MIGLEKGFVMMNSNLGLNSRETDPLKFPIKQSVPACKISQETRSHFFKVPVKILKEILRPKSNSYGNYMTNKTKFQIFNISTVPRKSKLFIHSQQTQVPNLKVSHFQQAAPMLNFQTISQFSVKKG